MDGENWMKAIVSSPNQSGVGGQQSGSPKQYLASTTGNVEMAEGSPRPPLDLCKNGVTKVLPFEFRALEVCLESACRCLESEV